MTRKTDTKTPKAGGAPPPPWAIAAQTVADGVRFLRYALNRFGANETMRAAASLTYTSMLAMVPLMAIGLAMLAAFPAFEGVREQMMSFLFENFVPAAGDAVRDAVDSFVNAAGGLTAIGVVFLGVTAVMMLNTIEQAMNSVFKVKEKRGFVARLMVYWTIMTMGPVLIGASFSLSGYLFALTHWADALGVGSSVSLLARGLPMILAFLAFTLIYILVPNRAVSIRSALIGGFVAGLMFAGLRYGFTLYVTNANTYQTVYGALATLPIFMIWLYLSWAVVLFGAEVTASVPEWRTRKGRAYLASGSGAKLRTALEAIAALRIESRRGRGLSRDQLLKVTAVPEGAVTPIMEKLDDAGFVTRTKDDTWVVVRDLELTTLTDLVVALGLGFEADADITPGRGGTWRAELEARIKAAGQAERQEMDMPISALLGEPEADKPEPAEAAEATKAAE